MDMERSFRAMKFGVIFLIFSAQTSVMVFAAGMQKVVVRPGARFISMQATASGQLSVSVVSLATSASLPGVTAGTAVLDLGSVSYTSSPKANLSIGQRKSSFIVATAFGLLVKDASRQANFATVSAFISGQTSRLNYSVDGSKLSSTPAVISSRVAVGTISKHRLEVEIPNSLTEQNARQQVALQFEVMPN